ncbi:hypothetical protein ACFL2D_01560 [Patescibacteria group bacterium]
MKITDFLRKIGIMRGGTYSGTFKNAKEMPTEMVTDTFNAEKETINEGDVEKAGAATSGKGLKWMKIASVVLFLFFLVLFIGTGISQLWIIISLILWVLYLIMLFANVKLFTERAALPLISLVVLVILSIIAIAVSDTDSSSSDELENKVVNVASEDGQLIGAAGVDYIKDGRVHVVYQMKVKEDLPTNWVCLPESLICGDPINEYTYIGDLVVEGEPGDDEGSFSGIRCNKDKMPEDRFDTSTNIWYDCAENKVSPRKTTDTFIATFSRSFDSYDDFLQANQYDVYDGSNFWFVSSREKTEHGENLTHEVDGEKAITESSPVKSYTLIFSE